MITYDSVMNFTAPANSAATANAARNGNSTEPAALSTTHKITSHTTQNANPVRKSFCRLNRSSLFIAHHFSFTVSLFHPLLLSISSFGGIMYPLD